jgi:hypothetical protein
MDPNFDAVMTMDKMKRRSVRIAGEPARSPFFPVHLHFYMKTSMTQLRSIGLGRGPS